MSYVFISYSRYDKAYVESLAMAISQRGLNAWYDVDIEGGDRWWRKISQKIEGCAAFVVVMSPDAEDSVWVEREVLLAEREDKPIIPLLLDGREFGMLINVQFYDVRDGSLPDEDFFRRLAHYVPRESLPETAMLDPAVIAEHLLQPETSRNPQDLLYSREHLWIAINGAFASIGITDFGQNQWGRIAQVELPQPNTVIQSGGQFIAIETDKVTIDVPAPTSGQVTTANLYLDQQPELINDDPFGKGWLVTIQETADTRADAANLMTAAEYAAYCKTL